jgi:uncharacterized protein YndB with AHSA1/START domain
MSTPSTIINKTFESKVENVWSCWRQKESIDSWFGPGGVKISWSNLDKDFFHYGITLPDSSMLYCKWNFIEIIENKSLTYTFNFTDKSGLEITRHPFYPSWPMHIYTKISFHDNNDSCKVTIEMYPHEASSDEQKTWEENCENVLQGWTLTLNQLNKYLNQ